ncbi:DNA cytosine methyltransferase [Candidatus Poribacteria bacterium]|nr:DNA cytosine methyltransferase [Candidatus Poribacteria bacterium]
MLHRNPSQGEVVDLFCGIGALSHGLMRAGFDIVAGYDVDARCRYAFEKNNKAKFFVRDVSKLTAEEINAHYTGSRASVLAGCAPCQPFSTYKHRYDEDPKWNLVTSFAKLAAKVQPDFVTMENVPTLVKYKEGRVFDEFCDTLKKVGYQVNWTIAKCEEFGIPQKRRRLVLVASRYARLNALKPTHVEPITVRQAIGGLRHIAAGESNPTDPLHVSASLSQLNMRRIQASKQGGTWRDWPKSLRADCHRRPSGRTYSSVYARMTWDDPSPTMTTQCYGYGNGRFGHPEQDRAISLREAAILQSFPNEYAFLPPEAKLYFKEIGRWIGNAVPIRLAEEIGNLLAAINTGYNHESSPQ